MLFGYEISLHTLCKSDLCKITCFSCDLFFNSIFRMAFAPVARICSIKLMNSRTERGKCQSRKTFTQINHLTTTTKTATKLLNNITKSVTGAI